VIIFQTGIERSRERNIMALSSDPGRSRILNSSMGIDSGGCVKACSSVAAVNSAIISYLP
jgi:hypothetical protein